MYTSFEIFTKKDEFHSLFICKIIEREISAYLNV